MAKNISNGEDRRDFLKIFPLFAIGTAYGGSQFPTNVFSAESKEQADWYKDIYRQLHIDAHFGGFNEIYKNFDAEAAAQIFEEAGVQMVSYFAKCWAGYSYYPTKLGQVHPGLKIDFTGELTAALKKRGIRRIIYFMMGTEREVQKEHPEWVYNTDPSKWTPDGVKNNNTAIMCFNSPYVDRYALPQMKEILDNYDVDGFFIDIVMQQYLEWNCYCKSCRELYSKEIGGEIPKEEKDPNAFKYRKWSNGHMEKHIDKVQKALTSVKPDIVIVNNYAWMSRYPVTPPDYVRHVTWDTPTPKYGLYSLDFSFEGRYLATLENTTWSCMNTRGNNWGEYSLREPEAFMQENATLLAACGRTYLSDIPYPSGNPDKAVMDVFGDVNKRTLALEPFVKGCKPVRDTAILHSADSIWSKVSLKPCPAWIPGPAYYSVSGAHKALTESHFQVSILNSGTFPSTLKDYSLAVIADQPILSKSEADAIRDFVGKGGILFVTADSGTKDANNNSLDNFSIADVLGVDFLGVSNTSNCYLRARQGMQPALPHGIPVMDIQVMGNYAKVKATTAKPLMELVPPFEGITGGNPPPAIDSEGVGLTVNSFGKGKAIYCSARIFAAYYSESTPVLRKLALAVLDFVYPESSRKAFIKNAPVDVELFYDEKKGARFVHLVNYSGDKREAGIPQVQDMPVIHDIKVSIALESKPKAVTSVPVGGKIAFEYNNGRVFFTSEPLSVHNVYMIEI